jgi:cell division protein ZapA
MSDAAAKSRDKGLAIQVLGREFRVGCPEGEENQLLASVDLLNERIQQLKESGKVTGNERLAIMAALNIAHEFLSSKNAKGAPAHSVDGGDIRRRIAAMQVMLDTALAADQDKLF